MKRKKKTAKLSTEQLKLAHIAQRAGRFAEEARTKARHAKAAWKQARDAVGEAKRAAKRARKAAKDAEAAFKRAITKKKKKREKWEARPDLLVSEASTAPKASPNHAGLAGAARGRNPQVTGGGVSSFFCWRR